MARTQMVNIIIIIITFLLALVSSIDETTTANNSSFYILSPTEYQHHFSHLPTVGGVSGAAAFAFAQSDAGLPFVDLPPSLHDIEAAYYYRAKLLKEHIIPTHCSEVPFVMSECRFQTTETDPDKWWNPKAGTVGCTWGDPYGVINAAAGHHIMEARWLREPTVANSYLRYFFDRRAPWTGKKMVPGPRDAAAWTKEELFAQYMSPTLPHTCVPDNWRANPRTYTAWIVWSAWEKFKVDGDATILR